MSIEKIGLNTAEIGFADFIEGVNNGTITDVPVPDGETYTSIIRGMQLDEWMGRKRFDFMKQDLARCCLYDTLSFATDEESSASTLALETNVCSGAIFAGIEKDAQGRTIIRRQCPSTVCDDALPFGRRNIGGRFFTPQLTIDETVDAMIEGLTPSTPEELHEIVKKVIKDYPPKPDVETYGHSEDRVGRMRWAESMGLSLQTRVFEALDTAKATLGDDYSLNAGIKIATNQILDDITAPFPEKYVPTTPKQVALSLAHLVATHAYVIQSPREY